MGAFVSKHPDGHCTILAWPLRVGGHSCVHFNWGIGGGGHLSASRFLVSANVALVYQRVVGGGGPGCAN